MNLVMRKTSGWFNPASSWKEWANARRSQNQSACSTRNSFSLPLPCRRRGRAFEQGTERSHSASRDIPVKWQSLCPQSHTLGLTAEEYHQGFICKSSDQVHLEVPVYCRELQVLQMCHPFLVAGLRLNESMTQTSGKISKEGCGRH
jgi:hypothetical protein